MGALDFIVDRDQHMRPLEYDLSESYNALLRMMNDLGVLDNIPIGDTGEVSIAAVNGVLGVPPRALTVYGNSTQDGTPTPDAPVPILSVDDLSLEVHGKNLITNSNRAYSLTGAQYATYNIASGLDPDTVSALTFSLQATVPSAHSLMLYTSAGERIYTNESQAYFSNNVFVVRQASNIKKILDAGSIRIYSTPYTGGSSVVTQIDTCQMELGTTATAYEPYIGTTVPDLLPEDTELRSLPDGTKDTLNLAYLRPSTREGWAWYSREMMSYIGQKVLDGTLPISVINWRASETSVGFGYSRANFPTANSSQIMSDKLQTATYGDLYAKTVDNGIALASVEWSGTYNVFLRVAHPELTTAELVNAWLAENPITVQYPLATPVTTQLDPIELPVLPAPTATVWCDGGSAQPTLTLEYIRDVGAALAEISEAIADIATE